MAKRKIQVLLFTVTTLLAILFVCPDASSQDKSIADGPSVSVDTVKTSIPRSYFRMMDVGAGIRTPNFLSIPYGVESKEQRAFYENALAHQAVMASVQQSLSPELSAVQLQPWMIPVSLVAAMTLRPAFLIPEGYVPMFNHSNPYALIKIPGWAPEENPTSPDVIPQAVRLVYNDRTGKYEQEMVPWKEVQMNNYFGKNGQFNNQALPVVRMNTFERQLFQSMGM